MFGVGLPRIFVIVVNCIKRRTPRREEGGCTYGLLNYHVRQTSALVMALLSVGNQENINPAFLMKI